MRLQDFQPSLKIKGFVFSLVLGVGLLTWAEPPSATQLEKLLSQSRKIDWSQWAKSIEDFSQVRASLRGFLEKTSPLSLRLRALEELGTLSTNEDGNVFPDVLSIFMEYTKSSLQNQEDFSLKVALMKALRNSNSPEALELLADLMNRLEVSQSELLDLALKMMDEIVAPRPFSAPAPLPYEPHLGLPLDARGGREKDWIESAQRAKEKLQALSRHSEMSEKISFNAQHTLENLSKAIEEAIQSSGENFPKELDQASEKKGGQMALGEGFVHEENGRSTGLELMPSSQKSFAELTQYPWFRNLWSARFLIGITALIVGACLALFRKKNPRKK